MIIYERCVMCEIVVGEDVEHLLVTCGEFERDPGGIWKYARSVMRHCCWEKVWRE